MLIPKPEDSLQRRRSLLPPATLRHVSDTLGPRRCAAAHHRAVLEAHHLQKSYGKRQVVKDVSLAVRTGEVVGLLGPNGAGKTTSFYMIVGLAARQCRRHHDRRASRSSTCPSTARARLGLGYLPQEASIFRKLNVEDNVRAVLELQRDAGWRAAGSRRDRSALDGLAAGAAGRASARRRRRWRCPAVSAAGWKLPGPWRPSRASSCWTSRLPASTRLR